MTATLPPFLLPLLGLLHWKGNERSVYEVLPSGPLDVPALRDAMMRLGFASRIKPDMAPLSVPALAVGTDGSYHILRSPEDLANLHTPLTAVLTFSPAPPREEMEGVTVSALMRRFSPLLGQIVLLSLIIGVMVLAPISYNHVIYDHIIAAGSTVGMNMMATGVLLALAAELALRAYRNRRLAFFGGRLDHYISCTVFERLLYLPPIYTERASVSAQLARLRDFESVREFFTGPLATLFFEMPLVVVYFIAMIVITGWLALVPLALFVLYALLIFIMNGRLKRHARASSNASSQRQEFLLETLTKLRAIRTAGLEDAWEDRYRAMSAKASLASFRSAFTAQTLETISYVLMTLGGIATLSFGVILVLDKNLTVGALVAAMMLVWRVIAPLQICCASVTRLQQLSSSTKQVQRLLSYAPEHDPYVPSGPTLNLKGGITFHRVSMRYGPDSEPALLGVTFDIRPGQIIAIKGNNGSGKSSILKLVLAMYQPQGGNVRLDGIDIRQFDPVDLRQRISYIPQSVDLLPGTVRDNLTYCNPAATDDLIIQALTDACAWSDVEALPHGLDTLVEGEGAHTISFMLRLRINLARAYIRNCPIMLFDEASYSLGAQNDAAFAKKIAELRGKSTVLLVTHREDHMRMADALLVLNKGELTHAGPPEQVLTVLKGKMP